MKAAKRKALEAAGWKVGGAKEFLGLDEAEALLIEVHLALSEALRRRRAAKGVTQAELARRLESSQSRVAKMEAGDPTVSLDLLVRGLFVLGATTDQVARTIREVRDAS